MQAQYFFFQTLLKIFVYLTGTTVNSLVTWLEACLHLLVRETVFLLKANKEAKKNSDNYMSVPQGKVNTIQKQH